MTELEKSMLPLFKVGDRKIKLIEFFGGIGAQAKALENLGANFEHHSLVEFDKYPVASYNAIHGTNFVPTDIRDVHAADLGMEEDGCCYIACYSFPCQDLSNAGLQKGMSRGTGTRSGLLWEVERILQECVFYNGKLPDVLVMENVPQVHGKKNLKDWEEWQKSLESLGYSNYWKDINAKDYLPQNRNRCFMVSVLGKYRYEFPEPPAEMTECMADYLDEVVDEKYYINSEKADDLIRKLIDDGKLEDYLNFQDPIV